MNENIIRRKTSNITLQQTVTLLGDAYIEMISHTHTVGGSKFALCDGKSLESLSLYI